MKIGEYTILDGNGDPIEEGVQYFNRYQSTIPHSLTDLNFTLKKFKTVGGFISYKPIVYFNSVYSKGKGQGYFSSTRITDGIYAFDQLIPVSKGITLNFEYCNTNSMIEAYKKKLGLDKQPEPEQKKISREKEIELAQEFFRQTWVTIEGYLEDTIYDLIDPECEVEGLCEILNNNTVLEVLKLGFKQKYGVDLEEKKETYNNE